MKPVIAPKLKIYACQTGHDMSGRMGEAGFHIKHDIVYRTDPGGM